MGEPIRESPGTVAIYPTTERKGRAKQVYLMLRTLSLEIHKSAKDLKNNKAPKYKIDLEDLFNICIDHEANQIKNECISLMTSDTTYFLLPADSDSTLDDWFGLLVDRVREARSQKLMRSVFREEFFEAAWDVNIIKRPKLRKDCPRTEKVDDLVDKVAGISGRKRFCVSPTCFLLFKMGVSATPDQDQPFDKESYTELPLNVISNYGKQEKYFFLRVGRCSEIGAGELWMATESGNSAIQLHERLSKINQREAEKRRQQGVMLSLGGISSRVLKSRQLRERAQQNKNRDNNGEGRSRTNTMVMNGRNVPDEIPEPSPTPEPTISVPTPPLSSPTLTAPPVDRLKEETKTNTPKKNSFADMAYKISSKLHYSGCNSGNVAGTFTANPEYSDNPESNKTMETVPAFVPPTKPEPPPPRTLSPRLYKNIAEDYMCYDPPVDSRKASTAAYTTPFRQVSIISGAEPMNQGNELTHQGSAEESDYIQMKATGPILMQTSRFSIKEARSYVSDYSDSTESCYSKKQKMESISDFVDDPSHEHRAFSLGSRPPLRTVPLVFRKEDQDEIQLEDIRKRAHSAGTWGFGKKLAAEDGEIRGRTGSMGNQGKKKNTDHVEIDFSDGSKHGSIASIDSPNVRSRNSSFGIQAPSQLRNAVDSVATINKLRLLDTTTQELAAVKVDETVKSRNKEVSSNNFCGDRRGSAPENNLNKDSDYVQITCPKKRRIIHTITEFSSSSDNNSTEEDYLHNHRSGKKQTGKMKSPFQGMTNSSGLEYTVVEPGPSVTDIDPTMIQRAKSFFPTVPTSASYPVNNTNCEYTVVQTPSKN